MIFVKDSINNEQKEVNLKLFLDESVDCFTDSILGELPPSRGEDDHNIELIPGISPPNKPQYRVFLAQEEENMTQVHELMKKGMVHPTSSPFGLPVLLVQKKDGSYHMCVDY